MKKYVAAVIGAGTFWGLTGFITRELNNIGIGPTGAIIVRCFIAAICFATLIIIKNPKEFLIKPKDFWCFIGTGIFSLLFFTYCYFNAINMLSLSVAAILLYLAPAIVTLLSAILFKEKITFLKIAAVILSFVGCALVSGITSGGNITFIGILYGVGAGLGYALYTVFSRFALQKGYSGNTVNFYSCLLASVAAIVLFGVKDTAAAFVSSPYSVILCIVTGIVSCFIPYLLYTYSLVGLENSKAAVLASVEPVVATLVGVIVYKEYLSAIGICGIMLVLSAIILLNSKLAQKTE